MALIKCNECGKSISDKAKMCPGCGYTYDYIFCPECNKKLNTTNSYCPECGFVLSPKNIIQSPNNNGENYGLAIAGFICSLFYITTIIGLIFGIIAYTSNQNNKNTAKSFGLAAIIISLVYLFILILIILYNLT